MLIFSVKQNNYEELIVDMIKRGTVLDHSRSPCEDNFIPDKKVSYRSLNLTCFLVLMCMVIDLIPQGYHTNVSCVLLYVYVLLLQFIYDNLNNNCFLLFMNLLGLFWYCCVLSNVSICCFT